MLHEAGLALLVCGFYVTSLKLDHIRSGNHDHYSEADTIVGRPARHVTTWSPKNVFLGVR